MVTRELDRLLDLDVDHVGRPVEADVLDAPALRGLPAQYRQTLARLNGFTVHGGANRLFGLRAERHLDLRAWNEPDGWRFAWDDRVAPYLCIGETAFGDQYALRRADGSGAYLPEVYLLEANFLAPEVLAATFAEFLDQEFVRNAVEPWDPVAVEAVARFGPIDPATNLVYTPSIALGGPEDLDNLIALDAFTAMTIAGDIVRAIDSAASDAILAGVAPWTDDAGRSRLRVDFRPP